MGDARSRHRSVTLFFLGPHLAGNIAGIAIFGSAVCGMAGAGVGSFMILVSGMAGNLVNALLYETGHLSVGSSTAVFGAIGILSAHQSIRKFRLPAQRLRAWLPVAAGLALLSILGSGKHTDLTAHLFGFMAGILIGAFYTTVVKRPAAKIYQASSLLIVLGILVLSWTRAL